MNEESIEETDLINKSKIRIKIGSIELEFEGREEFLKTELLNLFSSILDKYNEKGIQTIQEESNPTLIAPKTEDTVFNNANYTTSTIAARMHVNSASGLLLAACANLTLVKRRDSFTRQEIIMEMKTATHYFKQNYIKNLSKTLLGLIKNQKLSEISKEKYALTAQAKEEMEPILAE